MDDIEELKKLVDGPPDILIKKAEEMGLDFSELNKDIARLMVRDRFNLSDEEFEAVDFVFWIAFFIEREADELIILPEVSVGARKVAMENLVSKLHFGEKIKVIEDLHGKSKKKLVSFMRKIQDMRNDVAHGRFENLKYKNYHLSDNRGKLKVIADFRDALLGK